MPDLYTKHEDHLVQRIMEERQKVVDLEQQRDELRAAARYVAADLHSRGIVYPALDEAIEKAGG